jgi:hypothetical protein
MTFCSPPSSLDQDLKQAVDDVSKIMDDVGTVHDGVQIHVNHFGTWVAKYKAKDGKVYYAFGLNLLTALTNLKNKPNHE